MKKIGLLGLTFTDPNKGCEALTYTFLNLLRKFCGDSPLEVVCFMRSDKLGKIPEFFPNFKFKSFVLNIYSPKSWLDVYNEIKTCDCVFDASYGDGFTGIYGTRRNFVQALRKQLVVSAKKPLYLLPQTYGSYKFPFKRWSLDLIEKANLAYARDEKTALSVGPSVKVTSDLAFGLPFDKSLYKMDSQKKKFGLNISSLIWDKETVGRFMLSIDYREFCRKLLDYLINSTDYEVHLISHVIDAEHPEAGENDYRVCQQLKKQYGDSVVLAPPFDNAIEAKSYIANMDVFLGARMHSTIGAISAGVVTIPLSYTYKFEALYSAINYNFILSATKETTDSAIEKFKKWMGSLDVLRERGKQSVELAKERLGQFEDDLKGNLHENGLI